MLHKTHLEIKGALCILVGGNQNVLNRSGYHLLRHALVEFKAGESK